MFSMLSFHVLRPPSCKHEAWLSHIQGVVIGDKFFFPGLSQKMVASSTKLLARRLFFIYNSAPDYALYTLYESINIKERQTESGAVCIYNMWCLIIRLKILFKKSN